MVTIETDIMRIDAPCGHLLQQRTQAVCIANFRQQLTIPTVAAMETTVKK